MSRSLHYTKGPCDNCARARGGHARQGRQSGQTPQGRSERGALPEQQGCRAAAVREGGEAPGAPRAQGGVFPGPIVQGQELRFDGVDKGKPLESVKQESNRVRLLFDI